jgi:hypothetical protein
MVFPWFSHGKTSHHQAVLSIGPKGKHPARDSGDVLVSPQRHQHHVNSILPITVTVNLGRYQEIWISVLDEVIGYQSYLIIDD